ncbi:MAG: porin [Sideroxydans sp.]|nr:porin [Sideroxydans sp.]
MQQKLIVLTIAAAFSAPTLADNANVNVYGKAYLTLDSISSNATGAVSTLRTNSNASRFGVKGSEELGDGLKGIYQFEVQVDGDGSGGNGLGNGTRNSGVGLEGDFGKVIVGVWDTPFKVAHNKVELFDNASAFTALNLIGRAGAAKNFNSRLKNIVQYWTPKFGSVQGAVSYAPDEAKTATTNKSDLAFAATFEQDDLYAAAAYESRPDATTAGTTDSALRLVGKYTLGDVWVGATVESIKVNTSATASYSQKNLELVGQYKLGADKLAVSYAKAGKTATANTGATQLALRYGHEFSKRTELFAAYTTLKNDSAVNYDLNSSGIGAAGDTKAVFGAGLIHAF